MEKEEINETIELVLQRNKTPSTIQPLKSQDRIIFPAHGFMVIELVGTGQVPLFQRNSGQPRYLVNNQPLASGVQKYIAEYGVEGDQLFITQVEVETVLFTDNLQVGLSPDSPTAQQSGSSIGWPTDTSGEAQALSVVATAVSTPAAVGTDTTLIAEITLAVPKTNTGVIYVGNSSGQPIPLYPPAEGITGISFAQVKLSNLWFSASNTTDTLLVFYGGA